jgi:hypothetical protein
MVQLAAHLFREVSTDFFRVLASPLASLYVDVLDALDREAAQSNQGLDRDEALALVQQVVEKHIEIAELADEDPAAVATPNHKARSILETLRKAGWLHEEERSNWQRLIHFEPNGTLLLQTLRKIASPEAAVFSDKLVNVWATLANRLALAEGPWPQIESCTASLQMGLAELRGMQKSIERHTKKQLAASTLKENLAVLFDQFAERIGRTCYAQLVQARLPSKLAAARRSMDELENDLDLLTKMQTEVMRRAPTLSPEAALAHVRVRLNELRELLDQAEPLADAIDRRTADFARRSQARFRYLQETASENRGRVQTFFETINRHFAGHRMSEVDTSNINFPALLLHDVRVPGGLDSLYSPRLRRTAGEIEPLDDSDRHQQDSAIAQLEGNIRDSLTVNRANRFVATLPGSRGSVWNSADLLRDHVHNDEDMAYLIACLLHARSADAEYEIRVPRCDNEADSGEFDCKLRYRVERFVLVKK